METPNDFLSASRIGDDDVDAGEELARLHECERVRRPPLRQRHAVVPQRAQVAVHRRRVGGGGSLQAPEREKGKSYIYNIFSRAFRSSMPYKQGVPSSCRLSLVKIDSGVPPSCPAASAELP